MATISVLLADDNAAILTDLRNRLSDEFEIVGTAENGEEAVRAVLCLDPDIVVLDMAMPVLNGFQVASFLHEKHPRTKVLFFTVHEDPEFISAAFSAGARGYVTKRQLVSELAFAIREVYGGREFVSASLRE